MASKNADRPAEKNHETDISNANKGTSGTNITCGRNQGKSGSTVESK